MAPVIAAVGAALSTISVGTILTSIATSLAISYVANRVLGGGNNQPALPEFTDPGVRQRLQPNPANKLPVVYGHARLRGAVTMADISDNNQTLYFIISLCEGPVNEIFNVRWDDRLLSFDGDLSSGLRSVINSVDRDGNDDSFLNGNLRMQVFPAGGRCAPMEANSSRWAAGAGSRIMPDVAYMYVELDYNREENVVALTPDLSVEIEGRVVRRFEGDGTTLSSTESYSISPAECAVDFLLNDTYGCELTEDDIDLTSFRQWHDFCVEQVPFINAEGTEVTAARHECNGFIDTNNTRDTALTGLFLSASATMTYNISQFGVIIDRVTPSTMSFTNDNIYGDVTIQDTGFLELVNRVTLRYNAENSHFQEEQVILESPEAVKNASEPVLERTLNLEFCHNNIEAERIGSIILNKTRQSQLINFRTDSSALEVAAGDVITFTFDHYGIRDKLYRVVTVRETIITGSDVSGTQFELPGLEITAREYADEIYADRMIHAYDPAPNTGLPNIRNLTTITDLAITNVQAQAETPSFGLTWTHPTGTSANSYLVFYNEQVDNFSSSATTFLASVDSTSGFTDGETLFHTITGLSAGNYHLWVVPANPFARGAESNSVEINWNPQVVAEELVEVYRFHDNVVGMDPGAPTGPTGTGGGWYGNTPELGEPDDPNPHWEAITRVPPAEGNHRALSFDFGGTWGQTVSEDTDVAQDLSFEFSGTIGERAVTTPRRQEITEFPFTGQTAAFREGSQQVWIVDIGRGSDPFGRGGVSDPTTLRMDFDDSLPVETFTFNISAPGLPRSIARQMAAAISNNTSLTAIQGTVTRSTGFGIMTTYNGNATTVVIIGPERPITTLPTVTLVTDPRFVGDPTFSVRAFQTGEAPTGTPTAATVTYSGTSYDFNFGSGVSAADAVDEVRNFITLTPELNGALTTAEPTAGTLRTTSRAFIGDDTTIAITAGANASGETSTNNLAVTRSVTQTGQAQTTLTGVDTRVIPYIGNESLGLLNLSGMSLTEAISAIRAEFNSDSRYTTSVSGTTLRLQSTFTGVEPLASIAVESVGVNSDGTATNFAIARTITEDGTTSTITAGQNTVLGVTFDGTTTNHTITANDPTSAASEVLGLLIETSSRYTFGIDSNDNTVITAESVFQGSSPDLSIVVVTAGRTATDAAAAPTVTRTVTNEGAFVNGDLTDAVWTYFPINQEIRVDGTDVSGTVEMGAMNGVNNVLSVRRGLVEDTDDAFGFTGANSTVAFERSGTVVTTGDAAEQLVISGTMYGNVDITSTTTPGDGLFIQGIVQSSTDNGATWTSIHATLVTHIRGNFVNTRDSGFWQLPISFTVPAAPNTSYVARVLLIFRSDDATQSIVGGGTSNFIPAAATNYSGFAWQVLFIEELAPDLTFRFDIDPGTFTSGSAPSTLSISVPSLLITPGFGSPTVVVSTNVGTAPAATSTVVNGNVVATITDIPASTTTNLFGTVTIASTHLATGTIATATRRWISFAE